MAKKEKTNSDCRNCPALCCKNLAMEIGKPANKKEVEDLKWQLQFDTVKVYIRKNRWHQLVKGRCMYLAPDNFCLIYQKRPETCRKHNPPNCEKYGQFYDILLNNREELEKYLLSRKKKKREKAK